MQLLSFLHFLVFLMSGFLASLQGCNLEKSLVYPR